MASKLEAVFKRDEETRIEAKKQLHTKTLHLKAFADSLNQIPQVLNTYALLRLGEYNAEQEATEAHKMLEAFKEALMAVVKRHGINEKNTDTRVKGAVQNLVVRNCECTHLYVHAMLVCPSSISHFACDLAESAEARWRARRNGASAWPTWDPGDANNLLLQSVLN